ncbi:MAG: hypothetical protein IJR83_06575 [Clostridia bacterium]|nr:hypothetical protein [Clostridia bacterium]
MKKKKLLVSVLALALGIVLLAFNCYGSYGSKSLDETSGSQHDRGVINAGLFYVNNKGTGHYLKYNSSVTGESGLLSNLGTYIKWYFYETSNGYTIHPNNASGDMYLAVTTDGTGVEVISSNDNREYPERCYWDVIQSSFGYLLRGRYYNQYNILTYKYLKDTGSGLSMVSSLPQGEYDEQIKFEWRIVSTSDYGASTSYTYRELGSQFSVNPLIVAISSSATPTINKYPSTALWANPDDFTYSTASTGYISISHASIIGLAKGTVTVTATHKVTGRSKTFTVSVQEKAILVGIYRGTNHDHSTVLDSIKPTIEDCGFCVTKYTSSLTKNNVLNLLDANSNSIFVIRTDGDYDSVYGNYTYVTLNSIASENLYSSDLTSTYDLSNMRLILYIACHAGKTSGISSNLPSVSVARGAETALGFEDSIYCAPANDWTEDLFNMLENGTSLSAACSYLAQIPYYSNNGLANYHIYGNSSITIN